MCPPFPPSVSAVGVDIDPMSLSASKHNMELNGISEEFVLYHTDDLEGDNKPPQDDGRPFDVVSRGVA